MISNNVTKITRRSLRMIVERKKQNKKMRNLFVPRQKLSHTHQRILLSKMETLRRLLQRTLLVDWEIIYGDT